MYTIRSYLYPYYDIENTELYNWNVHQAGNQAGNNNSIKSSKTPTFGMYVSYKEFILMTKIAAIMYGMYKINGQNISSNPQVSALLDLLLMGWRGCASAMGVIKTPILLF